MLARPWPICAVSFPGLPASGARVRTGDGEWRDARGLPAGAHVQRPALTALRRIGLRCKPRNRGAVVSAACSEDPSESRAGRRRRCWSSGPGMGTRACSSSRTTAPRARCTPTTSSLRWPTPRAARARVTPTHHTLPDASSRHSFNRFHATRLTKLCSRPRSVVAQAGAALAFRGSCCWSRPATPARCLTGCGCRRESTPSPPRGRARTLTRYTAAASSDRRAARSPAATSAPASGTSSPRYTSSRASKQ